jgi:hypothetical protein
LRASVWWPGSGVRLTVRGRETSPAPRPAAREDPRLKEALHMTIVWILIVIILVLLVIALARRVL